MVLLNFLQNSFEKIGEFFDYLHNTRAAQFLYTSEAWNNLRRNTYGTYVVDIILSIDDECHQSNDEYFCKHLVSYEYNGVVQQEYFDAQQILQLCKKTGFPGILLSEHFSVETLVQKNRDRSQEQLEPAGPIEPSE